MTMTALFDKLYRFKVHHILLWVCYFVFWIWAYIDLYPTVWPLVQTTAMYFVFDALPFYITVYYLFPKFLYKRRYGLFFFWFFVIIILCSFALGGYFYLAFKPYAPAGVNFTIMVVMAFTSIIMVVGMLGGAKLIKERLKSDRNERRIEHQRLESELQYLKAQVNPHFLFNAINSVYILIRKDPDKAAETLIKLSDLLRFQLYDCSEEKIPVEKEIEYLRNFVELEKVRRGSRVKIDWEQEGILSGFTIAPFMIIPFLENAFKYVSNHPDQPNQVRVSLSRTDDKFSVSIFNTHDRNNAYDVGGIGLKNVKRRLELIYPDKHTLSIEEKPHTYSVTLQIDLAA
jgi:two-component system LytT family sensor kinase